MVGMIMKLLPLQMIMGMFGKGGGGGFNMSKIMNMVMMMTMLPVLMKSVGGLGIAEAA